jgi:hypothetical protein
LPCRIFICWCFLPGCRTILFAISFSKLNTYRPYAEHQI